MVTIPEAELNSGHKIPLIGFGTASFPFGAYEEVKRAVLEAIEVGYRHFDTATLYQSEQPLGDAVVEAVTRGLIKSRHELFITTKLYSGSAHPDLVVPALRASLKNLRMEYVDLYLIHFPIALKPGSEFPFTKDNILEMDMAGVWKSMEECQNLGLTKSIGVSNFTCFKIHKLLEIATIPPAVNQVEVNPCWHNKKLIELCKEKGIHVTAYSVLGGPDESPWGGNQIRDSEILKDISNSKAKTLAQICLRWAYEEGVSLVVKSFKKERMIQNLDIFGWNLSIEEIKLIDQIPQSRSTRAEDFIHEDGVCKSLEELWDGEI